MVSGRENVIVDLSYFVGQEMKTLPSLVGSRKSVRSDIFYLMNSYSYLFVFVVVVEC